MILGTRTKVFIVELLVGLLFCLGLSGVAGTVGYMDPLLLTGTGIKDPLVKQEAALFVEACARRGVGASCDAGVRLVTRGEFWPDTKFATLPLVGNAIGITYFGYATTFKNIFLRESLKTDYTTKATKMVIWHELAHAVLQAEHNDSMPSVMNSGFGIYDFEKESMSWEVLEELLFRGSGFPGAIALKSECNTTDFEALGSVLRPSYCTNYIF